MKRTIKEEDVLGGTRILGQKIRNQMDFHFLISRGMPAAVLIHIKKEFRLSDKAIGRIIAVSSRTVSKRRKEALLKPGRKLSLTESNRLYGFARIVSLAQNVFQDKEAALSWLNSPQESLERRIPFDFLRTYIESSLVEKLLLEIQGKMRIPEQIEPHSGVSRTLIPEHDEPLRSVN